MRFLNYVLDLQSNEWKNEIYANEMHSQKEKN